MAIVRININAMKFDEITVTFQPVRPRRPTIIKTEKKQLAIGTMEIENEHLYFSTSPLSSSRTKKNEIKSKIMKYNIEDHSEVWSHTYEDKINNSLNISSLFIV